MSRIFIVGSGRVGTATGRALGNAGHRVTFVDTDPRRVAVLIGDGLDARADLSLAGEPESFIFLCTPTRVTGERHHLADVAAGAEVIGRGMAHADCPHIVVTRSTVPPGTTRDLVRPLIELHSGRREGSGFAVAASPYFDSRPRPSWSRRLPEPQLPPLTVIGADTERVTNAIRDLLSPLVASGGQMRLLEDPAEAEMVKCVHSLFNATKISFWNEIWRVCDRIGIDPDEIAETVAMSAEGSLNPEYGIWGGVPYAGNQLPGDTQGFLGYAEEIGLPMPLLSAVVSVNSGFRQRLDAELEAMSRISACSPGHRDDPWAAQQQGGVGEEICPAGDFREPEDPAVGPTVDRAAGVRWGTDRDAPGRFEADSWGAGCAGSGRAAADREGVEPTGGCEPGAVDENVSREGRKGEHRDHTGRVEGAQDGAGGAGAAAGGLDRGGAGDGREPEKVSRAGIDGVPVQREASGPSRPREPFGDLPPQLPRRRLPRRPWIPRQLGR